MNKTALSCLALSFCLSQFGCDQKPSLETPVEQAPHDATGYLLQPESNFLVGGESRGWKHLFIQFDVNGNEARPLILSIADAMLPHDNWPSAPNPKKDNQSGSGFMFRPIEDPPRPFGWVSLNSEEVAMLAEAAKKYSEWSDTALKEKLNVEGKQLLSLTNQQFTVSFSRPNDSTKSFMTLYVPDYLLPQSPLPPLPFSITLDKPGVNRLLCVITNLPSRRGKFIAFRDEQEKIVRQRSEAQQNDKARADALLH